MYHYMHLYYAEDVSVVAIELREFQPDNMSSKEKKEKSIIREIVIMWLLLMLIQ